MAKVVGTLSLEASQASQILREDGSAFVVSRSQVASAKLGVGHEMKLKAAVTMQGVAR